MALHHDLSARLAQLSRPRYGRELYFAGTDLPDPERITVRTRHGKVRCLRYPGTRPERYLHLHGGAFMMRHPEMDDFWARFVVATTGLEVLLADYSVAPQVRYPVAHEQVHDVARHLAQDAPLVIGGFSAGGNLAASVALLAAAGSEFALRGQLLGVPSTDVAEDVREKCARTPHAMLGPALLNLVRATYFKDASRRGEPWASPLRAPDLTGLPPAFVVTAERDVLRGEGDAYAQRLRAAGVPVEHVVAPGVDHYFLHGAGGAQARSLMDRMAGWIAAAAGAAGAAG